MESPVKLGGRPRRPRRRPSARSVKPIDYDAEQDGGVWPFSKCFGNKCDVVEPIRAEELSNIQPKAHRASSSRWAEPFTSLLIKGFETLNESLNHAMNDFKNQQSSFINHLETYKQQLNQLSSRLKDMKAKSIPMYSTFFISYLDAFIKKLKTIDSANTQEAITLTETMKGILATWPEELRLKRTDAIQSASKTYIDAFKEKMRAEKQTKTATQSALHAAQETRQIMRKGQSSKTYEGTLGESSRRTERARSASESATTNLSNKIATANEARNAFIKELEKEEANQLKAIARSARSVARTESAVKRGEAVMNKTLSAIPESSQTAKRIATRYAVGATGGREAKPARVKRI